MAHETVQDSQTTELRNGGVLPRRAQPGRGRDASPLLIYLPRIDAPPEQIPVHPQVLAFLTTGFSKPQCQRRAASPETQPGLAGSCPLSPTAPIFPEEDLSPKEKDLLLNYSGISTG